MSGRNQTDRFQQLLPSSNAATCTSYQRSISEEAQSTQHQDMVETMKQKTKKEREEVKSKDGDIRRNLDRIRVSATTLLPSNPSRRSQVTLTEKFLQEFTFP